MTEQERVLDCKEFMGYRTKRVDENRSTAR